MDVVGSLPWRHRGATHATDTRIRGAAFRHRRYQRLLPGRRLRNGARVRHSPRFQARTHRLTRRVNMGVIRALAA